MEIDEPYAGLESLVNGHMIHESPDGGKTIRSRPSFDHPVTLLTNGKLPMDIWYKIYGNKNG